MINIKRFTTRKLSVLLAAAFIVSSPLSAYAEEIVDVNEELGQSMDLDSEYSVLSNSEVANQRLEINQGLATLTVDGKTKQLTPRLIAKDGGIAADGTVYILYDVTNTLWAYNYELQEGKGDLIPIVTTQYPNSAGDTSVLSLTFSNNVLTGYTAEDAGTSTLFTLEQLRARGIASGQIQEPDNPNPDNPDPDNPNPDNPNPDNPNPDNPNPDNPNPDNPNPDNPNPDNPNPDNPNPDNPNPDNPNPDNPESDLGTIRIVDGKIIYSENVNGVVTETTIPIVGTVDTYGTDKYGTFAVRTHDKYLYLIQPSISITPYLYSKECNSLAIENDKVVGFNLVDGTVPVLEPDRLSYLMLHVWHVSNSGGSEQTVYNPDGKKVLVIKYTGKSYKLYTQDPKTGEFTKKLRRYGRVKSLAFSTDGTLYVIKRGGKLYRAESSRYKLKRYNKTELKKVRFDKFICNANGTAFYALDKTGALLPLF